MIKLFVDMTSEKLSEDDLKYNAGVVKQYGCNTYFVTYEQKGAV